MNREIGGLCKALQAAEAKDKKTARQQQTKMTKGGGIELWYLRVLPYDRNGGFKERFPKKQTRLRGHVTRVQKAMSTTVPWRWSLDSAGATSTRHGNCSIFEQTLGCACGRGWVMSFDSKNPQSNKAAATRGILQYPVEKIAAIFSI